jgi:hypothetical protein
MKEKLYDFKDIILTALYDYKRWFEDINMSDSDKEKVEEINKAIKFVEEENSIELKGGKRDKWKKLKN